MTNIFDKMPVQTPGVQVTPQVSEQQVQKTVPAMAVEKEDTVELSTKEPKEKKGLFWSIKSGIASIKKAFASIGAYAAGTFKGIGSAAVSGSVVFTGSTIFNAINQKKIAKAGEEAAQKAKTLPAKALGIATAAIAFGLNLFTAHLNANEASSKIDHRWTGHDK